MSTLRAPVWPPIIARTSVRDPGKLRLSKPCTGATQAGASRLVRPVAAARFATPAISRPNDEVQARWRGQHSGHSRRSVRWLQRLQRAQQVGTEGPGVGHALALLHILCRAVAGGKGSRSTLVWRQAYMRQVEQRYRRHRLPGDSSTPGPPRCAIILECPSSGYKAGNYTLRCAGIGIHELGCSVSHRLNACRLSLMLV